MPFFRVEIYKNMDTRDAIGEWSNTYELEALTPGTAVLEGVNAILAAERSIHLPRVQFIRYTLGQYLANSDKLDPAVSVDTPLVGTGLRDGGSIDYYDLEMAYQTKITTAGRAYGKKAYHGCLTEGDVTMTGRRKATLDAGSSLSPFGLAADQYNDALAPIISLESGGTRLGCYTRFQTSPRKAVPKVYGPWAFYPASSVNFLKIGNVKMDHGWFNRTG